MAADIKEILGDLLLTAPVSRDEWHLPSPAALRRKIILKHKKLQLERDSVPTTTTSLDTASTTPSTTTTTLGGADDPGDQAADILSRECTKRGVLHLRDNIKHCWSRHVFVLFADRLCYVLESVGDDVGAVVAAANGSGGDSDNASVGGVVAAAATTTTGDGDAGNSHRTAPFVHVGTIVSTEDEAAGVRFRGNCVIFGDRIFYCSLLSYT